MKRQLLTFIIVFGTVMGSSAQNGGLFQYGPAVDESFYSNLYIEITPNLPSHNQDTDQSAPLGCGSGLLMGLGLAYALLSRKRSMDRGDLFH